MHRRLTPTTGVLTLLAVLALLSSTLVLGSVGGLPPAQAAGGGFVDLTGAVAPAWTVTPGVQTATVTGAAPFTPLTLLSPANERLITMIADSQGQAHIAYVPTDHLTYQTGTGAPLPTTDGGILQPGSYRIVDETPNPKQVSPPFTVIDVDDHPPTSLYTGQSFGEGFTYITVRDGVTISIMVRFPLAALYGTGPYPTVVEYSGYGPANPGGPEPGSRIANLLGYATVGVNMRGSGCSGGVFDIFNPAQAADGYDVIETIARQPWVLHNAVGMVGLSYSGISQLYVAATAPPSLAAITPLSVIEDPWYEQWPSGIYNSGFTKQWLAERDRQNAPGGSNWVTDRITNGDTICADNQHLRTQNPDFESFGQALEFRPPDADTRKLSDLVPDIEVPTYLTGAWQDEQTGSRFAIMLDKFTKAPVRKFTMFNGRHPDGYTPLVLSRWYEFLEFYVAKRVPRLAPIVRAGAPVVFEQEFHAPNLGFEPDRFFDAFGDNFALSKAFYEAEQPVRILFENGAGDPAVPGSPKHTFEASFPAWPPPSSTLRRFFLGPDGSLTAGASLHDSVDRFEYDPLAGPLSYTATGAYDFLFPTIDVDWERFAQGKGLSYETPPLGQDMIAAGFGYLDLWMRSTATDADLEVVVTEVYPDGSEVFVQNGLLRAGDRTVDAGRSSGSFIEHHYDEDNYQPLPAGELVNFQVPLFAVAHPFRAGSRLRVLIDTAGRDLPLWQFETRPYGTEPVFHEVHRGGAMASSLVLPFLDSPPAVPPARPACNALRGQVCRTYEARANTLVSSAEPPTTLPPPTTSTTGAPPPVASPAFTG